MLLITSDYFLGKGYKTFYKRYFEKLDFIFHDRSFTDIIFLGNSRANFGINPFYIDSICKIQSYNLGLGGSDIKHAVFFLQSYLQNHPAPKLIVLTYDYRTFLKKEMVLAPMYFYYAQNNLVRHELERFKYHATLLNIFPFFKYAFFTDYDRTCAIRGLYGESINDAIANYTIEKDRYDYKGFINYQVKNVNFVLPENDTDVKTNQNLDGLNTLNTLVKTCSIHNIKLAFIYPPEFYTNNIAEPTQTKKYAVIVDSTITALCRKNNFYYQRFDLREFTKDDFADAIHLNLNGSKKYSILLGNYLKTILN